jgi:hypothetical protein
MMLEITSWAARRARHPAGFPRSTRRMGGRSDGHQPPCASFSPFRKHFGYPTCFGSRSAGSNPRQRSDQVRAQPGTGKSAVCLSCPACKDFFAFTRPKSNLNPCRPAPTRGAYRDRHGRGARCATDASSAFDERRQSGRQRRVVLTPRRWQVLRQRSCLLPPSVDGRLHEANAPSEYNVRVPDVIYVNRAPASFDTRLL